MAVSGLADIDARVDGDIENHALSARGRIAMREIQIGQQRLSEIAVQFASADELANCIRIEGMALGGRFEATADLPNSQAEAKTVAIAVNDMRLTELDWLTTEMAARGVKLTGSISGSIMVNAWDDPSQRAVTVKVRSANAKYAGIRADNVEVDVTLNHRKLTYSLTGDVLDGELAMTGETSLGDGFLPEVIPLDIHLHEVRLRSLSHESERYVKLKPLTGAADLVLTLQLVAPDFVPKGTGRISVREVAWEQRVICASAQSPVIVDNGFVRFQGIRAGVGQGVVAGRIDCPLSESQSGSYDLRAQRVDVAALIQFTRFRNKSSRGTMNAHLSGTIGSQIRGRGDVELRRPSFDKISAGTTRVPIIYMLDPKRRVGRVETRRMTASFADGRITADIAVDFGSRLDINAQLRLAKVDTGMLLQSLAGVRDFDQGRLSGTLNMKGNAVRSLRDLQGRFLGELEDSQSLQLPVLNDLAVFANMGQVSRTTFDSGAIDIRLNNGIISTPGFTLQSDQAELFITGKANINQRLDLDVALQTGNIIPNFGLNSLIGSPVAYLTAPGASILLESAEFLSNRVIYLHVGGTFRSPHFRLRTDQIVRDELLRYYMPTLP